MLNISLRRLLIAAGTMLLSACVTELGDYGLPDPDPSLDPQALVEPKVLFICGKWVDGAPPAEEKIFVDVAFVRRTLDEPANRPMARDVAAVERNGGRIAYKFHLRAVRAWIPAASIPSLEKEPEVNLIFRVRDLRRYDWVVGVGYKRPYSFEQGALRFEELGGRVTHKYNAINGLSGLFPDRSVEAVIADTNVDYIEGLEGFPYCS